ncbi:MAG: hypothetical protein IPI67_04410 [Myxococcales bacterium]|nr:hypothetical protein [Myxococcales bacterium]
MTHENQFAKLADDADANPDGTPKPGAPGSSTSEPAPVGTHAVSPVPSSGPDGEGVPTPKQPEAVSPGWPAPVELHLVVRDIPAAEETSLEAAARYIRAHEPNPRARVKAHCDFPADGVYRVLLFRGQQEFGTYEHVGTLEAVSRR